MQIQLILSILSDDRPGVVRAIADIVSRCDGSWLDSHLSRLCGKFAGVVVVAIPEGAREDFSGLLSGLAIKGVQISIEELAESKHDPQQQVAFRAAGPDRQGLVLELSQALVEHGVNVLELSTECSSMPYSGEPLFTASGVVALPAGREVSNFASIVESLENELAMDIEFGEG